MRTQTVIGGKLAPAPPASAKRPRSGAGVNREYQRNERGGKEHAGANKNASRPVAINGAPEEGRNGSEADHITRRSRAALGERAAARLRQKKDSEASQTDGQPAEE